MLLCCVSSYLKIKVTCIIQYIECVVREKVFNDIDQIDPALVSSILTSSVFLSTGHGKVTKQRDVSAGR